MTPLGGWRALQPVPGISQLPDCAWGPCECRGLTTADQAASTTDTCSLWLGRRDPAGIRKGGRECGESLSSACEPCLPFPLCPPRSGAELPCPMKTATPCAPSRPPFISTSSSKPRPHVQSCWGWSVHMRPPGWRGTLVSTLVSEGEVGLGALRSWQPPPPGCSIGCDHQHRRC